MIKKGFCFLLSAALLLCLAVPAFAEEPEEVPGQTVRVATVEEFLTLGEKCRLDSYSQNLTVVLEGDLDLSESGFESIPTFSGTFEGNGHTISGLTLTGDGSVLGLFRYLTEGAVVKDLNVNAVIAPGGSRNTVGAIAGSSAGRISNCKAEVQLSGNDRVGGMVGVNEVSGVIEGCRVQGSIQGSHFVGGIAGKNSGVIRDCENRAKINITAQENTVSLSEVTLDSLIHSESATTVTDVGGIAGISGGVIRACRNTGDIGYPHMGYNIGGIAGTQSGYLVDCENRGSIQGRKEVGGIAGQMEPAARIEYDEDALQILKRQLGGMSGIVNQTAANVQSSGDALYGQVEALQDHVATAQDSIALLLPDPGDPQLPDGDTIQAARNGLSGSMSGMNQTLQGMSATTGSAIGSLSNNLHALQNQINAMAATLDNVSETLGGSIQDISDEDTPEDLTGKAENCFNQGDVLGDLNAGGITGAMALENDLNPGEDWDIQGKNSLNFESKVRCVVLNCENRGVVTVKKRAGGGIVGMQTLGLVKECRNLGTLDAGEGTYIGGISGESAGYIRGCAAKCSLAGERYVGGIAGSAAIATDNHSVVALSGGRENLGAILGQREEGFHEEQTPLAGNYYLVIGSDLGGIDGVSYDGLAQPLAAEDFFALETLEDLFRSSTITFRFENGTRKTIQVEAGGTLKPTQIPPIPEKEGYTASWSGLDQQDLKNILFSRTYEAAYIPHGSVIQSEVRDEGELPLLLLEGSFLPEASVVITERDADLPVPEGAVLLGSWTIHAEGYRQVTSARLRLPQGVRDTGLVLLMEDEAGSWQESAFTIDGSYLVFPLSQGDCSAALVQRGEDTRLWPVVAAGCLLAAGAVWFLAAKQKKRKDP